MRRLGGGAPIAISGRDFGLCYGRVRALAAPNVADNVNVVGGDEAGGGFGERRLGTCGAGVGFFLVAEVFGAKAIFFLGRSKRR